MTEIKFKEQFIKRYEQLTDIENFKEITSKYLRRSIRVNTLKTNINQLTNRLNKAFTLEKVPWCNEAFFVEGERRDLGNLIEHSLGYFYIQEAASLIPPLALDPKENEVILDMAAAPGSKTTQMAAMLNNLGIIIANDVKFERLKSLYINLQRCGVSNTIMTISKLQKKLIMTAFENLKEDGVLVYSTCSLEPDENEGVIDYLLNKQNNAQLQKIDVENIKRSLPVLEFESSSFNPEIEKCLRIWPQDNDTEGFFVAKIKKLS